MEAFFSLFPTFLEILQRWFKLFYFFWEGSSDRFISVREAFVVDSDAWVKLRIHSSLSPPTQGTSLTQPACRATWKGPHQTLWSKACRHLLILFRISISLDGKVIDIFLEHFLLRLKEVMKEGFSMPGSTKDLDSQSPMRIISQV